MVSWKPWAYYLVPRAANIPGWDVTRVFSDFLRGWFFVGNLDELESSRLTVARKRSKGKKWRRNQG